MEIQSMFRSASIRIKRNVVYYFHILRNWVFYFHFYHSVKTQLTFTSSTTETLEIGEKSVQSQLKRHQNEVNDVVLVFLLLALNIFHFLSSVSFVDFEQEMLAGKLLKSNQVEILGAQLWKLGKCYFWNGHLFIYFQRRALNITVFIITQSHYFIMSGWKHCLHSIIGAVFKRLVLMLIPFSKQLIMTKT